MTTQKEKNVKRDYKSTMFTMIFSDKNNLLELYNAVSGRNYNDPEVLTINTLENAIYMSVKNDISFLIDSRLSLYEHQSTYNPNMPLRFLIYLTDLYEDVTKNENIYSTKRIMIPAPRFVVFYNGLMEQPDYKRLCLSESYMTENEEVCLELKVDMYNINVGHNAKLLEACKTLSDYSEYVHRVRKYANTGVPIAQAVDGAIDECIKDGILEEFLKKQRAEAKAMSIYEYDYEKHMKMEREEHFADGRKQEAIENARNFFKNGADFDLVKNSIKTLSEEELQVIFKEIRSQN